MIDVALLPSHVATERLDRSQVVVLDVLRATSTIVTALANGAREVRLFDDLDEASSARAGMAGPCMLGGERQCVKVPGFDVGNSPAEYTGYVVAGTTVLLSTTNGTRAAIAVAGAREIFLGSLLNAAATAGALLPHIGELETLLVCAGTNGVQSLEDVIGAGAIAWHLHQAKPSLATEFTDNTWIAYHAFTTARHDLPVALRLGSGGIQIIKADLAEDIDACARLDSQSIVVKVLPGPLRAVRDE
jgi:2-phosphosulfolactate phosphatase